MALTMWYRGVRFTKDFLVKYLNYIFLAGEKDAIIFTDGTKKIRFSSTPQAIKRASWTYRVLPAVLIGKATGSLQYVTFSKDKLKIDQVVSDDQESVDVYTTVGGDFDVNFNISVRATTIEERDNLLDITSIYLAHPDAKDYFMNQYLVLPEAPRLVGESEISETSIDFPIYAADLSLRVKSRWQEWSSVEYPRLSDVIAEVEASIEL